MTTKNKKQKITFKDLTFKDLGVFILLKIKVYADFTARFVIGILALDYYINMYQPEVASLRILAFAILIWLFIPFVDLYKSYTVLFNKIKARKK